MSRENDINELIKGVMDIGLESYDESHYCPLCNATRWDGKYYGIEHTMKTIPHRTTCIYLIAKDLSTKQGNNTQHEKTH